MHGKFVVGVIGTQNTGKSTFIQDLIGASKGSWNEFQTVGCDYRKKIEEAGLSINRNGNLQAQWIIFNTLVEQLDIIDGMPGGNYITDRSPIDAYAYTVYLYRHNPDLGITQNDLDDMFGKLLDAVKRYDRIVYIDLDKCGNVEVVDDRFRDTDLEYRREIDQIFKETLSRLSSKAMMTGRLNSDIHGSRVERLERFLEMEGSSLAFRLNPETLPT